MLASGDAPAALSREVLTVASCIRTPLCTVPILSFFMLLLQQTDLPEYFEKKYMFNTKQNLTTFTS